MTTEDHLRALRSPDWLIRMRAADALGEPSRRQPPVAGDARAIRPLLEAAPDTTKNARMAIVGALWAIALTSPSPTAREELTAALSDGKWRVRFVAARAYGILGGLIDDLALPPITPLLSDEVDSVRWAATGALYSFGLQLGGSRGMRPDAWEALAVVLRDPVPEIRKIAAHAHGGLEGEANREAAIAASFDPHFRVRAWTTLNLPRHGAFDRLTELLEDPSPIVAQSAARLLGQHRRVESTAALIRALSHRNHEVRACAAQALAEIGSPDAVEPLMALLARLTRSWLRESVIAALGTLGDPRALPTLEPLTSAEGRIGPAAINAINAIRSHT